MKNLIIIYVVIAIIGKFSLAIIIKLIDFLFSFLSIEQKKKYHYVNVNYLDIQIIRQRQQQQLRPQLKNQQQQQQLKNRQQQQQHRNQHQSLL